MNDTQEVIWIGSTALIPGFGLGETGKPITLSSELAKDFISQGKAKAITKPKKED